MQWGENRSVSSGERHTLYHQFIPHIKCTSTIWFLAGIWTIEQTLLYIERSSLWTNCFPAATTWTSTEWKPDSRMEPFFPSTASSLRTNMATPRHSEQNWTGYLYNKPLEYTQLVLSGEIEHYLSLGCDHGRLEDWPFFIEMWLAVTEWLFKKHYRKSGNFFEP